jgi:SMC interacting uncharacterized protein involved in chromosome segregation
MSAVRDRIIRSAIDSLLRSDLVKNELAKADANLVTEREALIKELRTKRQELRDNGAKHPQSVRLLAVREQIESLEKTLDQLETERAGLWWDVSNRHDSTVRSIRELESRVRGTLPAVLEQAMSRIGTARASLLGACEGNYFYKPNIEAFHKRICGLEDELVPFINGDVLELNAARFAKIAATTKAIEEDMITAGIVAGDGSAE